MVEEVDGGSCGQDGEACAERNTTVIDKDSNGVVRLGLDAADAGMAEDRSAVNGAAREDCIEGSSLDGEVIAGDGDFNFGRAENGGMRPLGAGVAHGVEEAGAGEGVQGVGNEGVAADFLAGETIAVQKEDTVATGCEIAGGNGSRGSGSNYDDVPGRLRLRINGYLPFD
jgi:hypothetical protein